jgi:hypothetical protein
MMRYAERGTSAWIWRGGSIVEGIAVLVLCMARCVQMVMNARI